MTRRVLLLVLGLGFTVFVAAVLAQQPRRVPVVGLLAITAGADHPIFEALREGLRELGYVEGRNIRFEYRGAQGQVDRLPRLAVELVQLKVDAIVVGNETAARAASQASDTIPIVMAVYDYDPVRSGLIDSLSRPGGNITGVFSRQSELVGKRLELLKEMLPGLSEVAVFCDSFGQRQLEELEAAARSLGVRRQLVELRAPYDFRRAFETAKKKRASAVLLLYSPVFYDERARIAALGIENRLPVIVQDRVLTDAGALMSYGPDNRDAFRRAAYFIDRLLKGAKPNDLPVEQLTTFKLVINLRTAKALGLTVPQSVLLRADEVIP